MRNSRSSSLAKPLARSTLAEEIQDRLGTAIRSGELLPGTRLVEVHLARDLGVSRAPVREALQQLLGTGLVVVAAAGYRVPIFDAGDLLELVQLRVALEQLAARLMVARAKARVDRLEAIVVRMREAEAHPDGDEAFIKLDAAFHRLLCQESGNRRLLRCWESLADQIDLALLTTTDFFPSRMGFADEHAELLQVLSDGHARCCDEAIAQHILAGLRAYEAGEKPRSANGWNRGQLTRKGEG